MVAKDSGKPKLVEVRMMDRRFSSILSWGVQLPPSICDTGQKEVGCICYHISTFLKDFKYIFQLHQFPGYDSSALTPLPHGVSTLDILTRVVDAQPKLQKTVSLMVIISAYYCLLVFQLCIVCLYFSFVLSAGISALYCLLVFQLCIVCLYFSFVLSAGISALYYLLVFQLCIVCWYFSFVLSACISALYCLLVFQLYIICWYFSFVLSACISALYYNNNI